MASCIQYIIFHNLMDLMNKNFYFRFLLAYESLYGPQKSNSVRSRCLGAGVLGGIVVGAGASMVNSAENKPPPLVNVTNGNGNGSESSPSSPLALHHSKGNNRPQAVVTPQQQQRRASIVSIKRLEVGSITLLCLHNKQIKAIQ